MHRYGAQQYDPMVASAVPGAQFNYNLVHRNNAQNAGQSAVLEERQ